MSICNYDVDFERSLIPSNTTTSVDLKGKGYELAFCEWLESAKSFQSFVNRITEQLNDFGIVDWTYSRIDVPMSVGLEGLIGTPPKKQQSYLSEKQYADFDLAFQYTLTQKKPIFRSHFNAAIKTPISIDKVDNYLNLVEIYEDCNYYDSLLVPLFINNNDNHAFFTLSTPGMSPEKLQEIIRKQAKYIFPIIKTVERVGIEKFSQYFLDTKNSFDKIQYKHEKALSLLSEMIKSDITINKAADSLQINPNTANKCMANLRDALDVDTTISAVLKAEKLGLISTSPPKLPRINNLKK